ncbi:MAG: hypothetical protein GXO57_04065 [Thermodesulfobacteria bacterium]|nr:hypothetical protein [Thermodesulfobacteriota bacterium]
MSSKWEELSENLALELKKEIAENYFAEKVLIEEEWQEFLSLLEEFKKLQVEVFSYAWGIKILLGNDSDLISSFEKVTNFSLTQVCKLSKNLFPDVFKKSETELISEIFKKIILPFSFFKLERFVKLLLHLYEKLFKSLKEYEKEQKKAKKFFEILKEKTDDFNKKYDISFILNFFDRLEGKEELISPKEKEKALEELSKELKVKVPAEVLRYLKSFSKVNPPHKVWLKLICLGLKAYRKNKKVLTEIEKFAY